MRSENHMTTLYIVATPIGNLEDVSLRVLRILKEVDMIVCEDTRVTKKLLERYDIKTPTLSYFQHSKAAKISRMCPTRARPEFPTRAGSWLRRLLKGLETK